MQKKSLPSALMVTSEFTPFLNRVSKMYADVVRIFFLEINTGNMNIDGRLGVQNPLLYGALLVYTCCNIRRSLLKSSAFLYDIASFPGTYS